MGLCLQCGKLVKQPEGKKEKKFCNDTCRSNYRYAQNKKKKSIQLKQLPAAFEGQKLPSNFTADEPLSLDKLKAIIPSEKGYNEFKANLEAAEDIEQLEQVGRQIRKSVLPWTQKQSLEHYGKQIAQNKFF